MYPDGPDLPLQVSAVLVPSGIQLRLYPCVWSCSRYAVGSSAAIIMCWHPHNPTPPKQNNSVDPKEWKTIKSIPRPRESCPKKGRTRFRVPCVLVHALGVLKFESAKNVDFTLIPVLGTSKAQHRFLEGRAFFSDFECFA